MSEIKLSLSIELQGSTMFSKEECLKTTQETITTKNGRKRIVTKVVEDWDKMEKHTMRVTEHYADKEPVTETITFHTRKLKPATQSLNICKEGYNYMISGECPYWSKPKVWNNLSEKERLEAHLQRIAEGLGGTSYTYQIFED